MLKIGNVTPIFKKGDKQLIKNYRPISLLPIRGKILENIIFNNLYAYLHRNNRITKNQSGFRPGDSTTNYIFLMKSIRPLIVQNPLKLEQYLNDRKQRVVINGPYSDYSNIESGVPQGSVLGPLLFLV